MPSAAATMAPINEHKRSQAASIREFEMIGKAAAS
jgi:hypothetical protein